MAQDQTRKDPYQILGVSRSDSESKIKTAYRKLAKTLHPDLNPGNKQAEEKFKNVSAAYELLSDPKKKSKYDRGELEEGPFANHPFASGTGGNAGPKYGESPFGRRGPFSEPFEGTRYYYQTQEPGQGSYGEEFSFEDLFGEALKQKGQDHLYQMDVDLSDVVKGAEREITLPSGKRLRVKIPAGVSDGTKLRFSGQGAPGIRGGPPGDAYVELHIRHSPLFKREGNNLEIDLPISLAEAIAGAEVRIPTPDGGVMLKVPAGVNTGAKLRVRGKGIPEKGTPDKRGDLYVRLNISLPPSIDEELKRSILEWSAKNPYDPRAELGRAA